MNELAERDEVPVHFDRELLKPGAGNPEAMVMLAIKMIKQNEHKRAKYAYKAILLDADCCITYPAICERARREAHRAGISLIWQQPKHEALLLRHLSGCESRRPFGAEADRQLLREWPEYAKPMRLQDLKRRIDAVGLARARNVEVDLDNFLNAIGWRR